MKETVLLYNFKDRDRAMRVKQALLPLGFKLKAVEPEDYGRPLGILAGVPGAEEPDGFPGYEGPGFEDEMILMAGLSPARIDALILALRRTGVGRVDYKAMLTPTNCSWDSVKLYEELRREHEAVMAELRADKESGGR